MKNLFRSYYAKLSVLFLVLILVLGGTIAMLSVRSVMMFADEAEQKLNRNLAADLGKEFQPLLHHSMDRDSLLHMIEYVMGVNPRIEIYLLGSNGMIKESFFSDDEGPELAVVDTSALNQFLAGADIPILGPDPLQEGKYKPFSTANVSIMGEDFCYVYVILGSAGYDSAASMIRDSYIVQGSLRGFGLILLGTGVIGLFLFGLLTRRLRAMKEVVSAFERGAYEERVSVSSSDEFGQLGSTFNQMADTIVASMEDLKRTDQLRRELIANVSHDLRSPLATIQGYLETIMIKKDSLSPEERQQYMDIVLKNTRSLSNLVGELFELSKLDAHQIEPHCEALSVAELVQDVVMQFKPKAEKYNVTLEAVLPDRLALAYADIGLVERAISNLIDNAIRYTPAGGLVQIVTDNEDDGVGVRIVDTGYGIPEDDLPHIFERFYRVDKSRARDRGGAGLGLAITKKILELHGSTLSVQSVVDKGTTFSFALPRSPFASAPSLQLA